MEKLHQLQIELIKKLITSAGTRFNDLIIEGLESEHMNYHLQKLIELGFVEKHKSLYVLTDKGKDYSNMMDDEVKFIEKQPKTSILIRGIRVNSKGEVEYLLTKRLRQPYLHKVGRITGKVKFGETLKQAAQRELYEETGLNASFLQLEEVYHRLRYRKDKILVQDVVFYIFFAKNFTGNFIEKTKYQENFWLSRSALSQSNLDTFDDLELDDNTNPKALYFTESIALVEGY